MEIFLYLFLQMKTKYVQFPKSDLFYDHFKVQQYQT